MPYLDNPTKENNWNYKEGTPKYKIRKKLKRLQRLNVSTPVRTPAEEKAFRKKQKESTSETHDHDHVNDTQLTAGGLAGKPRRKRLKVHDRWKERGVTSGDTAENVEPLEKELNRGVKNEDTNQLHGPKGVLNPKNRPAEVPGAQRVPAPNSGRQSLHGPTIQGNRTPNTLPIPRDFVPTPPKRGTPAADVVKGLGGWVTGIASSPQTTEILQNTAGGLAAAGGIAATFFRSLLTIGGM